MANDGWLIRKTGEGAWGAVYVRDVDDRGTIPAGSKHTFATKKEAREWAESNYTARGVVEQEMGDE